METKQISQPTRWLKTHPLVVTVAGLPAQSITGSRTAQHIRTSQCPSIKWFIYQTALKILSTGKNGADWLMRGQPEVATRTAQTPSSSNHSADVQQFCSLKDDLEHHLQTFPVFSKGEECVLPCHIPRGVHTETRETRTEVAAASITCGQAGAKRGPRSRSTSRNNQSGPSTIWACSTALLCAITAHKVKRNEPEVRFCLIKAILGEYRLLPHSCISLEIVSFQRIF